MSVKAIEFKESDLQFKKEKMLILNQNNILLMSEMRVKISYHVDQASEKIITSTPVFLTSKPSNALKVTEFLITTSFTQ